MITKKLLMDLYGCCEQTAAMWEKPLNDTAIKYDLLTSRRLACFLAQIGHESNKLKATEENLNYSAEQLVRVWPNRFTKAAAAAFAREPEKIANYVYADRLGNGTVESGDGWRYRGRGLIQLTGKRWYAKAKIAFGVDFLENPDALQTPQWAAMSAGWFWSINKLNHYADAEDIEGLTKAINGGLNGLSDRAKLYDKAKTLLKGAK